MLAWTSLAFFSTSSLLSCLLSVLAAKLCFLLFSFPVSCPSLSTASSHFYLSRPHTLIFLLFFFQSKANKQNNDVAWGQRRPTMRCCLSQSQYSLVCVLCLVPRAPALMTTCWLRSWPPGLASRWKISSKSTRKVGGGKTKAGRFYHLDNFFINVLCMIHVSLVAVTYAVNVYMYA